jgi:hypothetical protein
MRDINLAIRQGFFSALDGNISYDGNDVNIYSEINPNTGENLYIVLTTQTEEDTSTKSSFDTFATILVDIVHKQNRGTATWDVVDNVAGQVLDLIQPTVGSFISSPDANLQFVNVKKQSSNTLSQTTDAEQICRRLLRFSLQVHEI